VIWPKSASTPAVGDISLTPTHRLIASRCEMQSELERLRDAPYEACSASRSLSLESLQLESSITKRSTDQANVRF
jgi:hypothetical protein